MVVSTILVFTVRAAEAAAKRHYIKACHIKLAMRAAQQSAGSRAMRNARIIAGT
jgi:hypothetical protein